MTRRSSLVIPVVVAVALVACGQSTGLPAGASLAPASSAAPVATILDAGIDAATPSGAGAEVIEGDGGAANPVLNVGPSEPLACGTTFTESWQVTNGAWVPGTSWATNGAAPTVTTGQGAFAGDRFGCLALPLAPSCDYHLETIATFPALTPNQAITFLRLVNKDARASADFVWLLDQTGVPHVEVLLGNVGSYSAPVTPGVPTRIGAVLTTSGELSLYLGDDYVEGLAIGDNNGETFASMQELDVGDCAGGTSSADALIFASITMNE